MNEIYEFSGLYKNLLGLNSDIDRVQEQIDLRIDVLGITKNRLRNFLLNPCKSDWFEELNIYIYIIDFFDYKSSIREKFFDSIVLNIIFNENNHYLIKKIPPHILHDLEENNQCVANRKCNCKLGNIIGGDIYNNYGCYSICDAYTYKGNGHLYCLKYLHQVQNEDIYWIIDRLIHNGHLELVKYYESLNFEPVIDIWRGVKCAIYYQRNEVLEYVLKNDKMTKNLSLDKLCRELYYVKMPNLCNRLDNDIPLSVYDFLRSKLSHEKFIELNMKYLVNYCYRGNPKYNDILQIYIFPTIYSDGNIDISKLKKIIEEKNYEKDDIKMFKPYFKFDQNTQDISLLTQNNSEKQFCSIIINDYSEEQICSIIENSNDIFDLDICQKIIDKYDKYDKYDEYDDEITHILLSLHAKNIDISKLNIKRKIDIQHEIDILLCHKFEEDFMQDDYNETLEILSSGEGKVVEIKKDGFISIIYSCQSRGCLNSYSLHNILKNIKNKEEQFKIKKKEDIFLDHHYEWYFEVQSYIESYIKKYNHDLLNDRSTIL